MRRGVRRALLLTLVLSAPAGRAEPTIASCADLDGSRIFNEMATVTGATLQQIKAGFDYCVVQAKLDDSDLVVETRMPMTRWNGRLVYLGGGGFNGTLRPFTADTRYFSGSIIADRYAIVVSNGGHHGATVDDPAHFDAQFASDTAKLVDFMFQSVHRALPPAREIVRTFYGTLPAKSYFEGCSTGGREALIEAQRHPRDFDGIIARGPAMNSVGLYTQFHRVARHVRTADGVLNAAQRTLLAEAVLARCDGKDGLADGILSNAAACDFNPGALRCPDGVDAGDTCLSDAQIDTVASITTPYASKDGSISHPGYNFGGENSPAGWGAYIWPVAQRGNDSMQGLFGDAFVRWFVTGNPVYDTRQWDPSDWTPVIRLVNQLFQATDPELSALASRGAKLILWNGEMDASTSSRDTTHYYENVVKTMGQARADQVVELFLAPGVGHCFGGVGPDRVDLLRALTHWVEKGVPPSEQQLNHEMHDEQGNVVAARPMCKYPAYPRYRGKGDSKMPGSFSCVSP